MTITVISPSKAPNLTQPTTAYSPQQQMQFQSQLRTYFVQVDNAVQQLIAQVHNHQVLDWLDP